MASIQKFTDIIAWQKAREITKTIYLCSRKGEFGRDYELRTQIRKSSVSVMANIAEGFGRNTDNQFSHFLDIAIGSLHETHSHLFVCLDVDYINASEFEILQNKCEETFRLLSALKRSFKK
jgi:four helix bundle protein